MDRRRFLTSTTLAAAGLPLRNVLAAAHAGPAMTRAWEVGDRKGFNSLRLVARPAPVAGPGEVVIEVRTSAINARDRAILAGVYPSEMAANRVPLSDGAGRVTAIGDGVTQVAVGDRVISTHFIDWLSGPWKPAYFTNDIGNTVDGWLADLIVLPAQCLVRIPDNVSWETACTLPVAGVTAWHALRMGGMNGAGKLGSEPPPIVLTLGTGGVSSWGLKLAKLAGAKVVITSSRDAKLERMQALGADIGINYKTNPDWGKQVVELTGGHGADIILENVGRSTLDQSLQAAAPNATIIMIGGGPPPKKLPTLSGLMMKNLTVKGLTSASRATLAELMNAVAENGIEAVIDQEFDFAQAVEAFRFMARSSHIGKVLIRN
jgi:NADPH:quinone reductase-like Zn-dependent oxidoreductase